MKERSEKKKKKKRPAAKKVKKSKVPLLPLFPYLSFVFQFELVGIQSTDANVLCRSIVDVTLITDKS